ANNNKLVILKNTSITGSTGVFKNYQLVVVCISKYQVGFAIGINISNKAFTYRAAGGHVISCSKRSIANCTRVPEYRKRGVIVGNNICFPIPIQITYQNIIRISGD